MPRLVLALAAACTAVILASAQEPTFHAGTHTVSIYATVVDRAGRLVTDLAQSDFQVLDNGRPVRLTVFKNEIQPITIVILLDRSGSMVGKFDVERDAAEQFVADLLPDDKARLGSFSNEVQIDPEDFTSDRNELVRVLHERLQDAGPTPLWNATSAAMDALEHQEGRRVVLVFTDGYDSPVRPAGNVTLDEVIRRSQTEEIMVYAIGFAGACGSAARSAPSGRPSSRLQIFHPRPRPPVPGGRQPRGPFPIPGTPPVGTPVPFPVPDGPVEKGRPPGPIRWRSGGGCSGTHSDPGLERLADEGGGGYFELRESADLAATFSRVANELHHQYLLAFTATQLDGTLHSLEVRLKNPRLIARARKSYLAKGSREN